MPLQKGQTADLRPKALTLMFAAGFILLIACANLAGLTVVRMARRTSEIATRMALGASRWHIQRQLWIENLLLAFIGGAVGVGVGFLALRGLLSLLPPDYLPVAGVPLDGRVLAFSLAASILTSVLFGMLPALALKRIDLRSFMATRTIAGVERLRLRQALIAGEVALTVVLLAASGLLIRTLIHLQSLPPGFNPQGVMTAKASLDDARYRDPAAFDRLLNESTTAMERIPGVQSAAVGLSLPYERALNDGMTLGSGPQRGQQAMSGEIYVTPSYFATLEIPLLAGRSFTSSDRRGTQPVAIVNRSFVRKYFGDLNPVGQTLDKQGTIIVGVAEDVALPPHTEQVNDPLGSEPITYIPAAQADPRLLAVVHAWFQPSWIVRTSGPIQGLPAQMQRALASVDPGLPFSGFYDDRSSCSNSRHAEDRGGSARRHGRSRAAFQRCRYLCIGGEFGGAAHARNRHPHRAGINRKQAMSHVAGVGMRPAAVRPAAGADRLRWNSSHHAQRRLWRTRIRHPEHPVRNEYSRCRRRTGHYLPVLRIARIDPATTLREE